jgi:hypothetical protein
VFGDPLASSFLEILAGALPNVLALGSWFREAGPILCTKLGAAVLAIRGSANREAPSIYGQLPPLSERKRFDVFVYSPRWIPSYQRRQVHRMDQPS